MNMRTIASRFVLCALLVTAAAGFAQNVALQANVPFDFSVNGKVLPAGAYEIRRVETNPYMVQILNTTTGDGVTAMTIPNGRTAVSDRLSFVTVGERYFLRTVSSGSYHVDLTSSKSERKAFLQGKETALLLK
jgi:hypothetical protein